jgi:hypothetical protein
VIEFPEHLFYLDDSALWGFPKRAGFGTARVSRHRPNPFESIRSRRPQDASDRDRMRSRTGQLRVAAIKLGPIRTLKHLTSLALRRGGPGSTLKPLAEK